VINGELVVVYVGSLWCVLKCDGELVVVYVGSLWCVLKCDGELVVYAGAKREL
jgi:hypothetical protein